jgi:hypothetical protein
VIANTIFVFASAVVRACAVQLIVGHGGCAAVSGACAQRAFSAVFYGKSVNQHKLLPRPAQHAYDDPCAARIVVLIAVRLLPSLLVSRRSRPQLAAAAPTHCVVKPTLST